jgi:hypothetical protein
LGDLESYSIGVSVVGLLDGGDVWFGALECLCDLLLLLLVGVLLGDLSDLLLSFGDLE